MKTVQVRVKGTINDVVDVDVEDDASDEEAVEAGLLAWQYVEYEDLFGEIE